jgi:hypothetical protein
MSIAAEQVQHGSQGGWTLEAWALEAGLLAHLRGSFKGGRGEGFSRAM